MTEGRSAWYYAGIGCVLMILLLVVGAIAAGFFLYRGAKRIEAELKDPAKREAKVLQVLGAESIPEGYHAMMAFSIPSVMEVAILTDREPDPEGKLSGIGERGLIYVETFLGQDEAELRDYFEGRTSDPEVLRRNRIDIDTDEILGRGVIPLADATLMYVSQRGRVAAHGVSGEGVTAVILFDCPGDRKMRTAVWFAPDPERNESGGAVDLSGTPADETAIAAFIGSFHPCR